MVSPKLIFLEILLTLSQRESNVWFMDNAWDFVEARKKIWIEYYVKVYCTHPAYLALRDLYATKSVMLLDFSCSKDHHLTELDKDMYLDILEDKNISLGHSYILYGMLKGWL